MIDRIKHLLPHLAAIVVFISVSAVYFFPALSGYMLKQGDIKNYKGMAKEIEAFRQHFGEEPLWTGAMFSGMPAYQISVKYPGNILKAVDKVFHLGLPRPISFLWLYMAGFYLLMLAFRVNPWLAISGAVAFGLSTYSIIILEAGHNTKAHAIGYMAPALAGIILAYRGKLLFGAVTTALFLALQIMANHVQITYYFGFMVVLVVLAYGAMQLKQGQAASFVKTSGALLVAATLAVVCNLNNLWGTYEYGKDTTRGKTELTINPDGSGNKENITKGLDRDYVTQWSYGKDETLTLLVPDAKGGASGTIANGPNAAKYLSKVPSAVRQQVGQSNRYWGEQPFTSGPVYLGAVIVLLFLLGAFYVKGPLKWALIATVVLTIMLSWGKNYMGLTDFFLDYIPGYDKFRAVTIILSITGLAVPLLGLLFLRQLWVDPGTIASNKTPFVGTIGTMLLLLILFAAVPTSFFDFITIQENQAFGAQIAAGGEQATFLNRYLDGLETARISVFQNDLTRSIVFVLLTALVLFLYSRETIHQKVFAGLLLALVLIDMWPVNKRFLNNEKDRGQYISWEQRKDAPAHVPSQANFAVLEFEARQNPAVQAAIDDFQQIVKEEAGKRKSKPSKTQLDEARFAAVRFASHHRVLRLGNPFNDAGTSYFHQSVGGYHGAKMKRYQELIEWHLNTEIQRLQQGLGEVSSAAGLQRLFGQAPVLNMLNTRYVIFNPDADPLMNTQALGAAWFVEDIVWANDADEEISNLGEIDPAITAVVDERYTRQLEGWSPVADSSATIKMETYLPNYLKYNTLSSSKQVAIFSEVFYDRGWKAYLDGNETEHFRANYILRGMVIPEGKHTIEFKFEPGEFQTAATLSTLFQVLVILAFAFGVYLEAKRGTQPE